MAGFSSLLIAFATLAAVSASENATYPNLFKRQSITSSTTGTSGGYYFSFYNSAGDVTYTNDDGGEYSVTWTSGSGNFVAGKGWNPGSAQDVTFTADYQPDGNSYLSVYGWTTDPLVEYYIMEDFGTYNPASSLTYKGSLTSDGSSYDVYEGQRVNEPSIDGTATFNQYWSIRADSRTSGTVTTANHFNAWASLGMQMGAFNYQILSTEGYESSGTSTVTVGSGGSSSGGGGGGGTTTTSAPSGGSTGSSGSCSALYGQCGGTGWAGATCCSSGTCQESNSYYSQCLD
uniref:endo-1,4-beta-xylanase n=1 Tax=uncultured eukaryote TaxID=100272 RepID=A0A0A8LF16_9EUKA|nr:glycoside hydrolase family 11 enzyme [uncultured eukaryote]